VQFYRLPNPFRVPVVECHIRYGEVIYAGLGCRLSLEEALARSFYEALNAVFVVIAGTRDDTILSPSHPRVLTLLMATKGPRQFGDERHPVELGATLARLKQRVVSSGFPSILVVDVTPKQTGLVAARVIVPGLEVPTRGDQHSPRFEERALRVYNEACTFIAGHYRRRGR
jgi:ribosomal protein S12 methylthiotransferase accessory factor YcaO